jgi:hypothetical protein
MFNFFSMTDNYESRKVNRYEDPANGLYVSTVWVTDSKNPLETAVKHKNYNAGKWIIVEEYKNEEEARAGHAKWVQIMTAKELPSEIVDVSTSEIKQLFNVMIGVPNKFRFETDTSKDD